MKSTIYKLNVMIASLATVFIAGFSLAGTIYTDADLGVYSGTGAPAPIVLGGLETHTEVSVDFDLYLYDSWDGNNTSYGPDFFGINIDMGSTTLQWTFSNFAPNTSNETNTDVADATGNFNSINSWGAIDREFINYNGGFTFGHTASDLTVSFFSSNLQGLSDESWQVKNLEIGINNNVNPVPEPATMLLFGTGLVGLIGSRIRKKK